MLGGLVNAVLWGSEWALGSMGEMEPLQEAEGFPKYSDLFESTDLILPASKDGFCCDLIF